LQRITAQSREALGARWLECFLSAPVWRFVVPAGMFSRLAWLGLIVPSVDRVGRYFPLTIAASVGTGNIDVPSTLAKARPWFDSLEALALEALTPELDLELFDAKLAKLAVPEGLPVVLPLRDDTVPLGVPEAIFLVWQLAPDCSETALARLLEGGLLGSRAASALWMTKGGETVTASVALCGGLISGVRYCAMLDGQWSDHSWTLAPSALSCDPILPGGGLMGAQGKSAKDPQSDAHPSREDETATHTKSER
jgi:type VI secretion system protein ImpM